MTWTEWYLLDGSIVILVIIGYMHFVECPRLRELQRQMLEESCRPAPPIRVRPAPVEQGPRQDESSQPED